MKKPSFLLFLTICLLLSTLLSALQTTARAQAELPHVTITLSDAGFTPSSVTVVVGQQVRWVNSTQAEQTLKFGEPVPAPDEEQVFLPLVLVNGSPAVVQATPADVVLTPGGVPFIQTFDEAGIYPFFLASNNSVRGEVVVQQPGTSTPTTPGTTETPTTATPTTATPTTPVVVRPRIFSTTPGDSAVGTPRDGFVTLSVALANSKPIDAASLSTSSVKLTRLSNGASEPATAALGAAGNLILVKPATRLEADTQYRLELTGDVRDTAGTGLEPFSMGFTTGAANGDAAAAIYFEQVALPTASGPNGKPFTALAIGPDGKLYAGTRSGEILRYGINADGTLTTPQVFTALQTYTGGSVKPRILLGIAFDPAASPSSPVLWLSHGDAASNAGEWSGKISKLSGTNLDRVQDVVVDLPRSMGNRMNAGLVFRPGSPNLLYVVQGSNSELGSDTPRPERLLSAAVLQIDLTKLPSRLPLSVKTNDGGSYNPRSSSSALTIFASGVRDAFDLAWHSNGQLYTPSRAAAAGNLTPAVPNSPSGCSSSLRMDGKRYTPPRLKAITITEVLSDVLIRVDPTHNASLRTHGYFGHPNPARCEFVLNGGNPTAAFDPAEVTAYAVDTRADPYFRGFAADLGPGALAGGILEYQSGLFGGKLQGTLLVPRAGNDDIIALTPGADKEIATLSSGIAGFGGLDDPLDLVENQANGSIYVSEASLTQQKPKITLLRPLIATGAQAPRIQLNKQRLIFNDVAANNFTSPAQALTIRNTGGVPLNISMLTLAGSAAGDFVTSVPSLPLVIPAQGTATISISMRASTLGIRTAALQLRSDDPSALLTTVELRGLGTEGTGGDKEPSLQQIIDTFDLPIDAGDDNLNSLRMPRYSLVGDEVALQRMQKAGSGPVTIEPLAVFGPARNGTTLHFGWYPTSNVSNTRELFTIAAADSQTLNPVAIGTTSFDPGNAIFSLYSDWPFFDNRRVYSEDFRNSWDPNLRHHVRAYPLKNSDGSVVANAYLLATEEHFDGNDTQDVLVIVRNVKPAGPPAACSSCNINVVNQTWFSSTLLGPVPFPERLAFSLIDPARSAPKDKNKNGVPDDGPNAISHDRNTLRISNSGSAPLTISALTLRGPWLFVNEPTLPLVIGPESGVNLPIRFVAVGNGSDNPEAFRGGLHEGWLEIVSSDPDTPVRMVELAGWWMPATEVDEPNLLELVQLFGYGTKILYAGQSFGPEYQATGEEVLSPYWERADTSKPVVVRYLAAYHGCCLDQGGVKLSNVNTTLKHDGAEAQTILPSVPGRSGPAQKEFTPNGKFSVIIDNYNSTRHLSGLPHGVRFWPARDRQGNLIPNTYLVGQDYAGSTFTPGISSTVNYDYQDNLILLSNVKPVSGGGQPGQVLDRIDAGKSTGSTTVGGVTWRSDAGLYSPGVPDENPGAFEIAGTTADAVYQSYRGKVGVGKTLTYKIPVSRSEVGVRLHFAEMYWGRPGGGTDAPAQRLFDIEIEGEVIVEDYDIYRAAGGALTAVTETIDRVDVGSDGLLEIKFTARKDNVSINGIEILAAQ